MDPLSFLSKITIILFIGLIIGIIARKLKLPTMLLLIITGTLLNTIYVNGTKLFEFSTEFLINSSILALVMIVFEGSSKFTIRELDTYSESALKLAVLFLLLNLLFLSFATKIIFGINNVLLSLIFAAVMSGTDPGSVLFLFHSKSNKITEILKFESVINTPIVVLIPFLLLDLMKLDTGILENFLEYILPFLQQIITGIGTGVFLGIIVFRFLKKFYSESLSPLTLITSALLTYIIADKLGGNGVLAVTVLGVFFGNTTVKGKIELKGFSNMLSNVLEMLVFILVGFLIPLNMEISFLIKSILLFMIMIVIRFFAITLIYSHDHINLNERIFMSLTCAKGIAVAVVAFLMSHIILELPVIEEGVRVLSPIPLISIPGIKIVIYLMVLFILYSIIVSSFIARFSQHFIRLKVEQ